MIKTRIAVVPGDGIGIEVTREARRVLDALGLPVEVTEFDWGADRYLRTGETLPPGAIADLRDHYAAILFGAVGDPRVPSNVHAREILLALRFQLDLYINLRPVTLFEEWLTPLRGKTPRDIDLVVLRENTEGLYAGVGGNFKKDTPDEVAINEDLNTRKGVDRILRAGFELARRRRKRLTMVDKANALEYAHGLWRRAFAALQREYPDVQTNVLYVDVAAMELVRAPERFDVLVTSNLFGDILSDLGAALVGGLGLAASGNIHPGRCSLFEPVHGSAPDIAGQGVANPLGAILTLALLLEHIGHGEAGTRVERAVRRVVADRQVTRDLGGTLHTTACTDAVLAALRQA
ncbi:MAG TPA: 3-isopropylmalate dehydrogenase [Polyangia bacterium]|jgi:3-isopropylmalate dehydrogenase|nr:3-isopropylmalate dehydrogenase [Polyangia bacterium]